MKIILIVVLILIIVLRFFKKTNGLISIKEDAVSILVTLLTTFIGAYLAINLTHEDIVNKEKSDIIKILEVSILEITLAKSELGAYKQHENDSIKYLNFLEDNKPRNIEIVNQISKSELFLKYVSKNTFKNLNIGFFTIQNINEWLLNDSNITRCKSLVDQDKKAYEFIKEIIESEIKLINGTITERELIETQNESLKKLFNNTNHHINQNFDLRFFKIRD